jgi:putative transposase
MNQLAVNTLLEWIGVDATTTSTERVLWINTIEDQIVLIRLPADHELPRFESLKRVLIALENAECRIMNHDPFLPGSYADQSSLAAAKAQLAWNAILSLIALGATAMFDPTSRNHWVQTQESQGTFTRPYLYKLLRRYWEGAQTRQALYPRYDRSGARGKSRIGSTSNAKRGRPRKKGLVQEKAVGINVDEVIRQKLVSGGKRFYESRPDATLQEAYRDTIKTFFSIGHKESFTGQLIPELPPEEELPTYTQFVYWYRREKRDVTATRQRTGSREYLLKSRALMGNATTQASGPGSIYEIDSTILDVNLVSSLDRTQIPGRPVLFVVVDVFSRMVVGFNVAFENASWRSALLALENVVADKATYCKSLNIPGITQAMWPSSHLPAEIRADRGEFEGYDSNALIDAFGIQVTNAAPYRADWKPFVERRFRLINDRLLKKLPGAVKKKTRGSKDTRLDSVIGLRGIRRLLAVEFLDYNNTVIIKDYPLDQDMVLDRVKPNPIELWNWGMTQRSGNRKTFPLEVVRNNLLPRAKITVTERGLRFKGMYFSAPIFQQQEWFSRARILGTQTRTISYDPLADNAEVLLHASHSREPELQSAMTSRLGDVGFIPCQPIVHRGFERNHSWLELEHELQIKQEYSEIARAATRDTQLAFKALRDSIVAEETATTQEALEEKGPISKRGRLQGGQESRRQERDLERIEITEQVIRPSEKPQEPKPERLSRFHASMLEALNAVTAVPSEEGGNDA